MDDVAPTTEDLIAIQDFDEAKEVPVDSNFEKIEEIDSPKDDENKAVEEDKTNESWELVGSETLGDSTSDISLINDDGEDEEEKDSVNFDLMREILEDLCEAAVLQSVEQNNSETSSEPNVADLNNISLPEADPTEEQVAVAVEETVERNSSACKFYENCFCLTDREPEQPAEEGEEKEDDNISTETPAIPVQTEEKDSTTDDFNIDWDQIFKNKKYSKVEESESESEDDEDVKRTMTAKPKISKEDDGDEDILSRILNNPKSINPLVADLIVKYWNRRMEEIKKEKPVTEPQKKCLIKQETTQDNGSECPEVKSEEKGKNEVEIEDSCSSDDDDVYVRPAPIKRVSLLKNRLTYQQRIQNITNYQDDQDDEDEEDVGKTEVYTPNYGNNKTSVEYQSTSTTNSTLSSGPNNLMEEIQKMKDEEESDQNVPKKVFNAEDRLTQLLSSYIVPENKNDDNDDSSRSDENDDGKDDNDIVSDDPEKDDNDDSSGEDSDDNEEINPGRRKNEYTSSRSDWGTRKFHQIGQKLQNYDFHDETSDRLFGYNLPSKFFFKEDREMRQSPARPRKVASIDCEANIQSDEEPRRPQFTSTGTSCCDLLSDSYSRPDPLQSGNSTSFRTLNERSIPSDLFGNCPEIRNFLDNGNFRPSSPLEPRFVEITSDDEIEDTKDIIADVAEGPGDSEEKFNLTFSKHFNREPTSVNDWKRLERLLEEDTERNCQAIEKFVACFDEEDSDQERGEEEPTVRDVWSLRSFKSHQQEDFISASSKEFSGGIFCQKPRETEEPPAFLRINDFKEREETRGNNTAVGSDDTFIEEIGNSFDSENIDDGEGKNSKCLIEELDLD